ncbi:MAG: enoyl-ACP reductase [Chloroflexi bacterium]|nr:enoyl-ACP reductase [Chloroflexota bacterium]
MAGKQGIIFGVANHRSIAWAIARSLAAEGAALAITYQNERLGQSVRALVDESEMQARAFQCDVASDQEIAHLYQEVGEYFNGRLDFLVHSLAYAPQDDLKGRYVETTREGFRVALDISAYSLIAVTQAALPLMTQGGSIITMTFFGGQRAMPSYGIMGTAKAALEHEVMVLAAELGEQGIRVNAISAGPLNTLAARGLRDFTRLRDYHRERAPLQRSVDPVEVGKAAVFLCSDASSATTGHVLFVDAGYNIMGY